MNIDVDKGNEIIYNGKVTMTTEIIPIETFSWSEIKTYQRCPKQHQYKYVDRLVPKAKSRPLFLGNWVHRSLQTYYEVGDWKPGHQEYVDQWNKLFVEEQTALRTRGRQVSPPFPEVVERIMKSYVWYNREETWEPIAIEQEFEVDTPLIIQGKRLRLKGIIDLIVRDEDGLLWVIDHKTAGTIPPPTAFHAMDPQLMLYPWAAKQAWGMDIAGIYYNYVRSRPPTIPKTNKDGSLSRRKVVTDYPTLMRFLKQNGYDPQDFRDQLLPLKRKSPFLRRYKYPREAVVTKQILMDVLTVAKHSREDKHRSRTITRDCANMCSFHDLCRAELNGLDTTMMRKHSFTLKESKVVDLSESKFEDSDEGE